MAKILTTNDFIKRANEIHKYHYDYSKVIYKNSRTKVCIICPEHDEFWQKPQHHLQGQGCPKCGHISTALSNKLTLLNFIDKANIIHNYKYDYSKTIYNGANKHIIITCPEHGDFVQRANCHLYGQGCPICGGKTKLLLSDFITVANRVHNNKYDYSKVNYVNNHTKVCIICPKHGEFWQEPRLHLTGQNCPKCNKRKSQYKLYYRLKQDLNINLVFDYTDTWLDRQSLDIYSTKYNFAIEFNGPQHYLPIKFFGGEERLIQTKKLDQLKKNKCLTHNCPLFVIDYNYTEDKYQDLIKSIKNIINNGAYYEEKWRKEDEEREIRELFSE